MPATQFTRSERRALRWMRRRGLGLQPSPAAFALLGERLAVRWRAGVAVYVPLGLFFAAWIWRSPVTHTHLAVTPRVLLSLVPVAVFGVAQILFVEVCRRSDRGISAALPQRISRPHAVSVWTVLGRFASLLVGVAVVGHVLVAAVLFRRDSTADGVAYVLGVAVVAVVVSVTLSVIVRRPTVAVDETALALDERIRATDALAALWPMYWAAFGLIGLFDLRDSPALPTVTWVSLALAIASGSVWFSHPGERGRVLGASAGRRP